MYSQSNNNFKFNAKHDMKMEGIIPRDKSRNGLRVAIKGTFYRCDVVAFSLKRGINIFMTILTENVIIFNFLHHLPAAYENP